MSYRIIAIDDERDFLESIRRGLLVSAFKNVRIENDPRRAAADFAAGAVYDAALIDLTMPGMDGIELLSQIKAHSPRTECIMITALDEARLAVESLRRGAYDYLVKPITKDQLVVTLQRAMEKRRLTDIVDLAKRPTIPGLENSKAFEAIVTRSAQMKRILKEAELHAASDMPILITGETGTGKELLAQAIHAASARSAQRCTPINMDALTAQLFDAEFFGHTRGAFTGAERDRAGYLEITHKGTLFLDEIGNLPYELQGKLLRVLQNGEYIKIGTSTPRNADVRIIAATNKNLEALMAQLKFRKDLYYRLKGGWIHLPPLRERENDIPMLVSHFARAFGVKGDPVADEAVMQRLCAYDYPGNVRELKSIVHSAVTLARYGTVTLGCLPYELRNKPVAAAADTPAETEPAPPLAEIEREYILKAYRRMGENKAQTAKTLGIGINTLRRKLHSYGVK